MQNDTSTTFQPGQLAWTYGSYRGNDIKQVVTDPGIACIVRTAHKDHSCLTCGDPILRGQLHAARDYIRSSDHYCLKCVSPDKHEACELTAISRYDKPVKPDEGDE